MPPADGATPQGPSRRDPLVLWLVAAVLLTARVATGVYEGKHPPIRPDLMSWVHVIDRTREEGHNSVLVDSLQRVHDVNAFPTIVIVGTDGKAIDRTEGFPGAQAFVSWVTTTSAKARFAPGAGASVRITHP